jgi:hypothetical protein
MQNAYIKQLILAFMVSFVLPIYGQTIDFAQYQPAKSQGDVPQTLKKSTKVSKLMPIKMAKP